MDIEELRKYCLAKKGTTESFPFDNDTLVFKINKKIFCMADLRDRLRITLKCRPDKPIEYMEEFDEVIPGYHMNKNHWNTVDLNGTLVDSFIIDMIDNSYELVKKSLTKKERELFKN
jgi:predicted DNA-binding protein (MmcQ/YjbR family)